MPKHIYSYMTYVWGFLKHRVENRAAHRYITDPDHRAALAWYEGGQHQVVDALIVDLSQGGVRVEVEGTFHAEGPVWLRLTEPESTEWVAGTLVKVEHHPHLRISELRIQFQKPCPYHFFKSAVNGFRGNQLQGRMTL